MNAVLDIIIIGIIIFCVAMGFKNGFIKSIMSFLSFIIAFFMAKTFSPSLSDYMYSSWIKPNFADKAAAQLEKLLPSNVGGVDKLVRDQPGDFLKMLEGYGFKIPDIETMIGNAAAKTGEELNKFVADNIVEPVAKSISYFLAFVAILAVSLILLKIATLLINRAFKLPGLNIFNRTGGIILGLLYGIIVSYIFVFIAGYVLPYLAANGVISSAGGVVGDTIFFKWFDSYSPVNYIMSLN